MKKVWDVEKIIFKKMSKVNFKNRVIALTIGGMKTKFLYLLCLPFLVVALFTGCKSGSDVYVAGWENDYELGKIVATLWKNGKTQYLTDGNENGFSEAHSVYVSGNNVFVAGWKENSDGVYKIATLWKNGIAQYLTDGSKHAEAHSVFVSGEDVYVVGYEQEYYIDEDLYELPNNVAKVWKNGAVQNLTDGSLDAEAHSVFVSRNDLYIVGYEGYGVAKLWKNGESYDLEDGTEAYSVHVSGKDVYIAGVYLNHLKLWKNGIEQNFAERGWGEISSVSISGKNVYVAGWDKKDAWSKSVAMLWKNDKKQALTDGNKTASAHSVFVSGKDVYVVGYEEDKRDNGTPVAKLWKNGKEQKFIEGNVRSKAFSVFVK